MVNQVFMGDLTGVSQVEKNKNTQIRRYLPIGFTY